MSANDRERGRAIRKRRIDGRIGSEASRKGSILQGSTPSPIRLSFKTATVAIGATRYCHWEQEMEKQVDP